MAGYLYTAEQIRAIEQTAIANFLDGNAAELMQRAAQAAYKVLNDRFPTAQHIAICCGKGNNAADAMYVGALAKAAGKTVTLILSAAESALNDTAATALAYCQEQGIDVVTFSDSLQLQIDLIIDGLVGIGLHGTLQEQCYKFIQWINAQAKPILAIDIPSGLEADTGLALEDCVHADVTVTFIGYKRGLFTHQGRHFAGEIVLNTLNLPPAAFASAPQGVSLMQNDAGYMSRRKADANKGDFGHVLIVGGDYGMGGAVRVAAEAALRVGAGKVTVATRPEHVCVVSAQRPELMCHQISDISEIDPLLEQATVVVIGPGLGMNDWGRALYKRVLESDLPKVVDADALNILAESDGEIETKNWILTPHPGEAARLLDTFGQAVQKDRFKAATALQDKFGGVVVLKGAGTIVVNADKQIQVCPNGNPGMASPGMGDLLSGLIGGFIAQGVSPELSAIKGVMVHAQSADIAAQAGGGERGLLAMDLLVNIRPLINPNQAVDLAEG